MDEESEPQEPYFAYISPEADDALELIFEHPDGISEPLLAWAMGRPDGEFLVEELRLAGIKVRAQVQDGVLVYLPPLR